MKLKIIDRARYTIEDLFSSIKGSRGHRPTCLPPQLILSPSMPSIYPEPRNYYYFVMIHDRRLMIAHSASCAHDSWEV